MPHTHLTVSGRPVPLERARRGRNGKWYTPAKSLEYRQRIQTAWMAVGRPSFDARPVSVCVYVYVPRPPSHYTSKGEIRTRHQHAIPPGDTDNYAKAIADALNQLAYRDDTQITCWAAIVKQWANTPGDARTDIRIWTNTPDTENDAQAANTLLNPPQLAARSAHAASGGRVPE